MARAQRDRELGALARKVGARVLDRIGVDLAARLRFQRSLRAWPAPPRGMPDATPYVSLYEDGQLRGCFGSHEGDPGERLGRAFLRALHDDRFPAIGERANASAEIAYVHSARFMTRIEAASCFEAGTHGVGLARDEGPPVLLLPAVARDGSLDVHGMLAALADKAQLPLDDARLFLFEVSWVAARQDAVESRSARAAKRRRATAPDFAAEWLERLLQPDGSIVFALDPRRRTFTPRGALHHARTSVVLRALDAHRVPKRDTERARRALATDVARALRGAAIEAWPADPSLVVGTLAHAVLAGVDAIAPLRALGEAKPIEPWYAAQTAFALGRETPDALWQTVVDDLALHPWAPWTCLAARARGDAEVVARTAEVLARSLRTDAPHRGGCDATPIPELALTALTIEALAGLAPARAAVKRGREFLERWQLVPGAIPAALDAALAMGGFPASPIVSDLRCDVVAHALLALH